MVAPDKNCPVRAPHEEFMSVIPANPLTNIHSLLTQPAAPRPAAQPQTPTPQSAGAADRDGDSDQGGVDITA
jgi:hypothetical protein